MNLFIGPEARIDPLTTLWSNPNCLYVIGWVVVVHFPHPHSPLGPVLWLQQLPLSLDYTSWAVKIPLTVRFGKSSLPWPYRNSWIAQLGVALLLLRTSISWPRWRTRDNQLSPDRLEHYLAELQPKWNGTIVIRLLKNLSSCHLGLCPGLWP